MPHLDVSLRQLRAFEATMRHRRISAAAEELHVTAPAIGQQLKSLRQSVGVEISRKTAEGFEPTNAGLELIRSIGRMEAELTRCGDALAAIATGDSGSVNLAAVSTAKYFAPILLAEFRKTHPDVQIHLLVGNREETVDRLEIHGADVAVMGRPPRGLDLVVADIGPNPHVVLANPEHPLANQKSVSIVDLLDQHFLVRELGSGTRSLADAMFRSENLTPPPASVMTSNETIKQAILAGLGIGLLSSHTVEAEVESGRLAVLAVEGLPIIRRWYITRPADLELDPAAQSFWDFLVADAAGHLPTLSAKTQGNG